MQYIWGLAYKVTTFLARASHPLLLQKSNSEKSSEDVFPVFALLENLNNYESIWIPDRGSRISEPRSDHLQSGHSVECLRNGFYFWLSYIILELMVLGAVTAEE